MSNLRKAAEMALEALDKYTCVVTSGTDPSKWNEVVDGGRPAREAAQALRQALAQPEPEPYKGISEYTYQATNGRLRIDPVTGDVGIGSVPLEDDSTMKFYTGGELAGSVDFPGPAEKPEQRLRVDGNGDIRPEPYPKGYENIEEFEEAQKRFTKELKQKQTPMPYPFGGTIKMKTIKDENGEPLVVWSYSESSNFVASFDPATGNVGFGSVSNSKPEQEPVAWIFNGELFWGDEYRAIAEKGDKAAPLYTAPPNREWVGLTDEDRFELSDKVGFGLTDEDFELIEAKLKEKNT